jgi:hypothetical protein
MNLDYTLARMDRLLNDYLSDCEKQERNRRPTELFGLKFGPSDDPLHERFGQDLGGLLSDFAAEKPDSASLCTVLEKLFGFAKRYTEPKTAHWMLIAVQGLSRALIPRLSREHAGALLKDYEAAWPRRARMPVQDEIVKLLKKAAQ